MRLVTTTQQVGEYLGPVDWSYDFLSHFSNYCTGQDVKIEMCEKSKAQLKKLEENKDGYLVTTDGGWPRCGWHDVLEVGMYDGWPYWRPVPSVLLSGTLGSEWHSFCSITDIEPKRKNT